LAFIEENTYKDEINALVPFLSLEADMDLIPFMNTRLMKFLMTYIITFNADISLDDSYLVLIG